MSSFFTNILNIAKNTNSNCKQRKALNNTFMQKSWWTGQTTIYRIDSNSFLNDFTELLLNGLSIGFCMRGLKTPLGDKNCQSEQIKNTCRKMSSHKHTHIHKCTHTYTNTFARKCRHTHTHKHKCTNRYTHTHTHNFTRKCTDTDRYTHRHTNAQKMHKCKTQKQNSFFTHQNCPKEKL